ncbi:Histidinol-phosphate phosphatase family protein [Elusimicrobium minutum Pei191]|uniref:D,D-heptose 1,7-bisphosphate phosphatase n=1 Tax=Elusimicrobium minutum (strain Pei191) TaxID=445932 RepID=B2KD59_ELUMP|nr:HAD family hydrolase [Elusimicrobium minutum]ACC98455.1 Histidinol-phosphate phosphatase family protein [Elusimicrobium minutum Pei191]
MNKNKIKAVFLDRDGTLIYEKPGVYLSSPEKVVLYKSSMPALKLLTKLGYKIFIVSNQSGIGRGYFTSEQVDKVHEHLKKMIKPYVIEDIVYCPHAPWQTCLCRKPNPILGQKLAKKYNIDRSKSFMIGDKKSDVDFGINLGAVPVLVRTANGNAQIKKYGKNIKAAKIASNLLGAAKYIESKT